MQDRPTDRPTEEWRSIPGFEKWEASSLGRIRSKKTGNVLHQRVHLGGGSGTKVYIKTNLGAARGKLVHRLVCLAFHGPDNGLQAGHLDDDGTNNKPENLRWMGMAENMAMRWNS